MITIHALQNNRMTVEFNELTIQQSLDISTVPDHLIESQITKMLRYCVKSAKGIDSDPINWTIQERMAAVSHYLACVNYNDVNGFDFDIGDGNYSDYFDPSLTISSSLKEASIDYKVGGDNWKIQHLTGVMAEAIELTQGIIAINPSVHFLMGSMAAQLVMDSEKTPVFELEQQRYDWLVNRINAFLAYPESDFELLLSLFLTYKKQLDHFFIIDTDSIGFLAKQLESSKEVSELPPTRFCPSFCISRTARQMAGLSK